MEWYCIGLQVNFLLQQEKVVTIHELIGRFKDGVWGKIPQLFENIAQQRVERNLLNPSPKPKWTGRIRLLLNSGRDNPEKLAWSDLDTQTLILAPNGGDSTPEPIFTVLNANGAEKSDRPILSSVKPPFSSQPKRLAPTN